MHVSAALVVIVLGTALGVIIVGVLYALTDMLDGGREQPEYKPLYSIVQTWRNRGQSAAALAEVRQQLERFPNEFEGVMLMAEIQARDLNDLPAAVVTLQNFCRTEGVAARPVALALTRLAEWQLKLADTTAARASLNEIVERFPGTEMALEAQQRLAHLQGAAKLVLAKHDPQPVPLPEGIHNLGLLAIPALLEQKEIAPGPLAAAYVKHLAEHPQDAEVREKLATIYARHFQRLELAQDELDRLIAEPNHPVQRTAYWLNLLATFQLELGAGEAAVRATLTRVVEKFPDTPVAALAERRLARVNLELKGRLDSANVKLGEYEQRLGLKYGRPEKDAGKNPV